MFVVHRVGRQMTQRTLVMFLEGEDEAAEEEEEDAEAAKEEAPPVPARR